MREGKKRLSKVEGRLTPTQAVILWMEEAHVFPSFFAYVQSLDGQPDAAYPLYRLPDQVEAATRGAMKGQPREEVDRAVRKAGHPVGAHVCL